MSGYWNDPEATRIAIRDGWLHTGDLVVKHPDGNYSIVGRKKELVITSGFNVYPGEVEATLREADGVKQVSVVGHPDKKRGEIVKAYIVLQEGVSWNEAALREFCGQRLSKHKRPRMFEQCHKLPEKIPAQINHELLPNKMNGFNGTRPPGDTK